MFHSPAWIGKQIVMNCVKDLTVIILRYNGANGYLEPSVPCLAISYETGRIQILRSERDTFPMTVDTNLKYLRSKWNPTGSILAVSGVQVVRTGQGEVKEICIVHFYDPYGKVCLIFMDSRIERNTHHFGSLAFAIH